MNSQTDLFTLTRRNDPETSRGAAARIYPRLTELQQRVYDWFTQYGPATHKELVAHFKRISPESSESTWRTRVSELRDQGLIVAVGNLDGHTTWGIK